MSSNLRLWLCVCISKCKVQSAIPKARVYVHAGALAFCGGCMLICNSRPTRCTVCLFFNVMNSPSAMELLLLWLLKWAVAVAVAVLVVAAALHCAAHSRVGAVHVSGGPWVPLVLLTKTKAAMRRNGTQIHVDLAFAGCWLLLFFFFVFCVFLQLQVAGCVLFC